MALQTYELHLNINIWITENWMQNTQAGETKVYIKHKTLLVYSSIFGKCSEKRIRLQDDCFLWCEKFGRNDTAHQLEKIVCEKYSSKVKNKYYCMREMFWWHFGDYIISYAWNVCEHVCMWVNVIKADVLRKV